jgi:TatA/E family protein of Tat protein translocase
VPSLGPLEILVIFIVALLVFGPNKLPELARQVGKGLAEFRKVQHHLRGELDDAIHSVMDDDKPKVAPPSAAVVVDPPPPALDGGPAPVDEMPGEQGPTPPPLADDA